jgi:hypothetical protein
MKLSCRLSVADVSYRINRQRPGLVIKAYDLSLTLLHMKVATRLWRQCHLHTGCSRSPSPGLFLIYHYHREATVLEKYSTLSYYNFINSSDVRRVPRLSCAAHKEIEYDHINGHADNLVR